MKALWLYLHFPSLQLDSLFNHHPTEHALIVLDPQENNVVQLNQQAQQAGIRQSMSLGTAAALSRDLQVIPYNRQLEEDKLREIAEHLYLATSDISFFAPQGLLLRVHTMLRLYQGLGPYWQAIKTQLAALKLSYHYATGHSPLAARMLASRGWDQVSADPQLLKAQIKRCALADTFLPDKLVQKLTRVGIRTVAELSAVPYTDIAKRFGPELVTYLGRLSGEFKQPVDFFHPPECFHRYLELLYEIDNVEVLQRPLLHLLKSLEQFLQVRDLLTDTLLITFYLKDADKLELNIGSQQGEYKAHTWLTLCALKLETLSLDAPVYAIALGTGETHIRSPDRPDLFAAKQGALSRLQLVALLQAKLGEQAVFSPSLHEDFRPEVITGRASPFSDTSPVMHLQALRPSFILNRPQPLQDKVTIIQGPERVDTGWWDHQPATRDYFIARNQQGQWYWIYRTPDARCYLHGVFS